MEIETVDNKEENRSESKTDTDGLSAQETENGSRMTDVDPDAIQSDTSNNEGFKDETSCEITEESSKDSKRRYDREFLMQFQHDSLVSTNPISLEPVISDIERHSRKHKKELYQSEIPLHKTNNNSEKYYRQMTNRNDHGINNSKDTDMRRASDTFNSDGICSLSQRETIKYDNKCFIVIDYEGVDDETENKKTNPAGNIDVNSEHTTLKTNEVLAVEGQLSTKNENRENRSEASLKRGAYEEHNEARGNGKRMKINHHVNYKSEDMFYRRRESSRAGSIGKTKGRNVHKSIGNKEKIFRLRRKDYSQRRSGQRSPDDWHSKKAAHLRVENMHETERKRSYKDEGKGDKNDQHEKSKHHDVDHCDTPSHQKRPFLYENGIQVNLKSEKETCVVERLENQLSPVSDRSISPYTDFMRFFHNNNNEEKVNPEKLNNEVNIPRNIVSNGISAEENGFQIASKFPMGGLQPNSSVYTYGIENRVNGYGSGLQNLPRPVFAMEYQTQTYFQSNVPCQGNQMRNFPFLNGQGFPVCIPNRFQLFNNNFNGSGRVQPHQNNITIKETAPIQKEAVEQFWISASGNNSVTKDTQNKIVSAIYRALIKADKMQYSPEDVIKIMRQNRPVSVEFETKYALMDLLKPNEDKFVVQNGGRLISPKTNIKICPTFTYDQHLEHECMDLHICKYFLLGRCPWKRCKFSHKLTSKHNAKVLKSNDLGGLKEKYVKDLIRDLNSRNISTTPLICKFYNNEGRGRLSKRRALRAFTLMHTFYY